MRRTIGIVLLGLFGFLLVVGLFAQFYAPGVLKKTPLDVNTLTTLSGQGSYLGQPETPVSVWQRTEAIGDKSTDEVIVMRNFQCVMKDPDGTAPQSPVCLDATDERLINASEDRFATDRVTALAVNDPKYIGADGVPHDGLVNKFPFDVEKKTYPFWDGVLGRAVDADFQGVEDVNGLTTYKFQIAVENESAEIATDTPGTYSDTKTMWIDPVTGSIIDQSEQQLRMLSSGDVALDLDIAFTDATVKQNVDDAKANGSKLGIIALVPWVSYFLAAVALVGGILLLGSSRPKAAPRRQESDIDEMLNTRTSRSA